MSEKIKVAVVTEFHPVDMINFHQMLWKFDDCECYVQSMDMLANDPDNNQKYDVVMFYNLSIPLLEDGNVIKAYLENVLGKNGQGVILLHHGICCYHGWDVWKELSGVADRRFKYHWDQIVDYKMELPEHPILAGVSDFTMQDETYTMSEPDYGENTVLITTEHPNSMKTIAWVRKYGDARVFCYESGHDNKAYTNENFLKVLHNAIRWCAKRV